MPRSWQPVNEGCKRGKKGSANEIYNTPAITIGHNFVENPRLEINTSALSGTNSLFLFYKAPRRPRPQFRYLSLPFHNRTRMRRASTVAHACMHRAAKEWPAVYFSKLLHLQPGSHGAACLSSIHAALCFLKILSPPIA